MIYIIILLLFSTAQAKQVDVAINDNLSYTYIDSNEDGMFDSLIVHKNNETIVHVLNQVSSKPSKIEYNESTFDVRLINYNDSYRDAYFRINLIFNGKVIGYYEHNYGKKELIYRGLE